jgi:hypothetical protein
MDFPQGAAASSMTWKPGPFNALSGTVSPSATSIPTFDRTAVLREIGELEAAVLERRRMIGEAKPPKLALAPPPKLVRLDLGCGNHHAGHPKDGPPVPNCKQCEGFEGVDIADLEGIAYPKVNLWKFPWPWADDSVDEIFCSHFVEHVPACYWNPGHDSIAETYTAIPEGPDSQDLFFRFFDECWRVLKHEGLMTVIVPALKSDRAFQDPTHRQFISEPRFMYLWKDARVSMNLGHYNTRCNFVSDIGHTVPEVETTKSGEASANRHNHYWNCTHDHVAKLRCIKAAKP